MAEQSRRSGMRAREIQEKLQVLLPNWRVVLGRDRRGFFLMLRPKENSIQHVRFEVSERQLWNLTPRQFFGRGWIERLAAYLLESESVLKEREKTCGAFRNFDIAMLHHKERTLKERKDV